jgi:hypothetical protein
MVGRGRCRCLLEERLEGVRIVGSLYAAPPLRTVGGEMMTLRLLKHSKEMGHDVSVLVRSMTEPGDWNELPLVPAHYTSDSRSLYVINNADIIVTHPEIIGWVYRMTRKSMRIPIVGIVHNLSDRTLQSVKSRSDMHVVANTQETRRELLERGTLGSRDCTVIYPPSFPPRSPVSGLPNAFCTMVNMSRDKGGEILRALAIALPDIAFMGVIGGHGEQVDVSDLENVTVMPHGPLNLPLHLTRVLIAPSRMETYNMTACEAIMLGIPVIASDLPGHREALGNGAAYVDAKDVDGWVKTVRRIFYDDTKHAAEQATTHAEVLTKRLNDTYENWDALMTRIGES